jgi:anti-anti-sigma factor
MKIQTYPKGIYQVLRIEDEVQVISDLSELQFLIEGYLRQGKRNIAVSFTSATYIYSGAIAILIQCFKKTRDGKGDLCIIEPKKEMLTIFEHLGISRIIPVYQSEDDLPSEKSAIAD